MKKYYTRNLSLLVISLAAACSAAFAADMSVTRGTVTPTEDVILGIPSTNGAVSMTYWGQSSSGNTQIGQSFAFEQSMDLRSAVFQIAVPTNGTAGDPIASANALGAGVKLTLYKLSDNPDPTAFEPMSEVISYTSVLPSAIFTWDFLYFDLDEVVTLSANVQYSLVLSFTEQASGRQISLVTGSTSAYADGKGVAHRNNSEWQLRGDNVSVHLIGSPAIPEAGTTALWMGGGALALVFAVRRQIRRRALRS